ncbi:MAG: pilus assembly protein TadG-related protein [Zhaonellaceae bacterium]|jgi:Flp pilus assembly protein TadG
MELNKFWHDEKGSVVVFIAAALTFLVGLGALVIDVGMLYAKRVQLQNVADAAALAGAQEIFMDDAEPEEVAIQYAVANGVRTEEVSASFDSNSKSITVEVTQTASLFLARVLGEEHSQVMASSTAQAQAVTSATGVIPLGIENVNFEYNKLYNLKTGSPSLGSGEFGALSLGGNGASQYRKNFKYGYDKKIRIGDIIETETGNMSGPTLDGVQYRINQDPSSSIHDFDRNSPRLVIVPVFEPLPDHGNQLERVKVVGFASFFIVDGTGHGNESYVKGYFVEMIKPEDSSPDQPYYGLSSIRLIN